jgi:hypothetical protein
MARTAICVEFDRSFDVLFTHDQQIGIKPPTLNFRYAAVDRRIGEVDAIGYPPWTYATGILLHSLPLPWGRLQFALLNLLAVASIGRWAITLAPVEVSTSARWVLPLSVFGTMSFCSTLIYGQYGVLLVAMIAWSASFLERRRSVPSGLLLGMAMLKPSCAIPFGLLPLCRRDWRSLAVTATYVAGGGLLVCWMTHTTMGTFISQMQADASRHVIEIGGLLKALVVAKVPLPLAMPALIAILVLAGGWWMISMGNRAGMLDRLAVAGLVARIFTYHRPYDDLLLVFLLLALEVRLMQRPTRALAAAMLAVGLSLWLPLGFERKWPVMAMQYICWIWGSVVLTQEILAAPRRPADNAI